jgi:hypothetical protein
MTVTYVFVDEDGKVGSCEEQRGGNRPQDQGMLEQAALVLRVEAGDVAIVKDRRGKHRRAQDRCTICGAAQHPGAGLCDGCWELSRRVERASAEQRAWLLANVPWLKPAPAVLGSRLVGSRLSADAYLDAIAVVMLAAPPSDAKRLAARLFEVEARRLGRDAQQVQVRVALAWGGFVPEVEER